MTDRYEKKSAAKCNTNPNRTEENVCGFQSVTIVRKICTGRREESCLFSSRWTWLCLSCTAGAAGRSAAHSVMDSNSKVSKKWPGHGRNRCVPLTSVWPIRCSAAVKTRGPLLSWPSCPELSGCQGAFPETQLISFPILATYVVGHRCQGRVEFSGCISASSSPV